MDNWLPMRSDAEDIEFYQITSPTGNAMATRAELAPRNFWSTLPIKEEY